MQNHKNQTQRSQNKKQWKMKMKMDMSNKLKWSKLKVDMSNKMKWSKMMMEEINRWRIQGICKMGDKCKWWFHENLFQKIYRLDSTLHVHMEVRWMSCHQEWFPKC